MLEQVCIQAVGL